jgi:Ca2+-binding EF-hand superfamily protein
MELRSGNNALQLIVAQKDELIEKLTREKQELKNSLALDQGAELLRVRRMHELLTKDYEMLAKEKERLEKQLADTNVEIANAPAAAEHIDAGQEGKLIAEMNKLIEQNKKLQSMYDSVNEVNKSLRHKSGQVFLNALGSGLGGKAIGGASGKVSLEDEEAVVRMFMIVEQQSSSYGDLRKRLSRVSFNDMLGSKQFTKLVSEELKMKDNDLMKLLKVSGFAAQKKSAPVEVETIAKRLEDAVANSAELREDAVKKTAKLMKDAGMDLEKAFVYFDTDGSGEITREELVEGFKAMKVTLNQALIENLFVILDRNADNEISLTEFEEVFDKYLGTGGSVADVDAADLSNLGSDAASIARQLNAEKKKKVVYEDMTLEEVEVDEIVARNKAQ